MSDGVVDSVALVVVESDADVLGESDTACVLVNDAVTVMDCVSVEDGLAERERRLLVDTDADDVAVSLRLTDMESETDAVLE